MLVWQDFVQMFSPPTTNATTEAQFELEAMRVVTVCPTREIASSLHVWNLAYEDLSTFKIGKWPSVGGLFPRRKFMESGFPCHDSKS